MANYKKNKIKKGEMKVKKVLLCLVCASLGAVTSINAYAEGTTATYNDTNDIATPTGTGNIENVIITDSETFSGLTGSNVFFIDQAPSGSLLNAAAGFAMKKDAPNGTYYMTLRYDDTTEKIPFTVKNSIKSTDVPMLMLDGSIEDGDGDEFSLAFVTENFVDLSEYKTVKFAFTQDGTTGYFGYYLKDMQAKFPSSTINLGDQTGVFLGVRLTGIENSYKNGSGGANVSMWLSKDENWKDKGGNE